jgi:hypothetical protein
MKRAFVNSYNKRTHTWGNIYRNALARGEDHGYAASLADQWEKRQAKRKTKCNRPSKK